MDNKNKNLTNLQHFHHEVYNFTNQFVLVSLRLAVITAAVPLVD